MDVTGSGVTCSPGNSELRSVSGRGSLMSRGLAIVQNF